MLKVKVQIEMDRDELKDTIYVLSQAALKQAGSYESELLLCLKQKLEDELGVIDDKLRDTFASPSDDDESYESDDEECDDDEEYDDDDESYDDNGNICTKDC